jgi:hypothetical protein
MAFIMVIEMVNIQTPNDLNEKRLQVADSKKETAMGTYERVSNFVDNRSTKSILTTIVISFIAFMHSNIWLGALFEKTGYPVALLVSQNRFSGSGLKSDFAVLVENRTLNDYKLIQYLDLYIMISTAICFGTIALAMSRKISHDSPWRKRGFKLALLFPLYIYSTLALSKLLVFIAGIFSIIVISIAARNDR